MKLINWISISCDTISRIHYRYIVKSKCFALSHMCTLFGLVPGTWKFLESANSSSKFPDFRKSKGNSIIELVSTPTKINGVHYVQVSTLELFLVTIMSKEAGLTFITNL